MSAREQLNPRTGAVAVLGAILLVAAGWWAWQSGGGGGAPVEPPLRQFLSSDDGATWFVDSSGESAAVTRDGREAVEAVVFACDGGGTQWVGYLRRYTPRGKQLMEALRSAVAAGRPPEITPELQRQTQIKPRGAAEWVSLDDTRAMEILRAAQRCPHNGAHEVEEVVP